MNELSAADFLEIVDGRRGHFQVESGHHSALWLDLDPLFAEPDKVDRFINALAGRIRPHEVSVVCGPLVGGAFVAQLIARDLGAQFCFTERVMPAEGAGLYPARYRLPASMIAAVRGKRVAIVDDVISAGSAVRGTYEELRGHGAQPVVAGALLALGTIGTDFLAASNLEVEAVTRDDFDLWPPSACPLCKSGLALEYPAAPVN